jgi:hypothetical protein
VPDGDGGEGEEAAPGEHVVPTAPMFSGEGGGQSGEGKSREWVACPPDPFMRHRGAAMKNEWPVCVFIREDFVTTVLISFPF